MERELFIRTITGFFFGILVLGVFYCLPPLYFTLLILIGLFIILYGEWPLFIEKQHDFLYLTIFYPVMPLILLIILNHDQQYRFLIGPLLLSTFTHDTACYLIGKLLGKHKLAPHISPKKTWQGLLGGLCALLTIYFCLFSEKTNLVGIVALSGIVTILATGGDLFESLLKRMCKLKDSGSLLPGHGGILDRIDSILFLIPFFFFYKDFLIKIFK